METTKKQKIKELIGLIHEANQIERLSPEGTAISMYAERIISILTYGVTDTDAEIENYLFVKRWYYEPARMD